MGFLYTLFVVAGITAVALIGKLSARKGIPALDLSFVIFSAATVMCAVWLRFSGASGSSFTAPVIMYAVVAGIGGSLAVFLFNHAIRIGHFGFSNAIYRSSFMMPVLFSMIFLAARLRYTTVAGIMIIVTAIFLMSWSNGSFASGQSGGWRWFLVIAAAFVLSGLPRIGQLLTNTHKENFFVYLFLSYAAGAIALIPAVVARRRVDKRALAYGSIAAAASIVGVYCTLMALNHLPAYVVYPITLSAPIMLGILISYYFKEKIKPWGWIGILLGISGILILAIWK
ncbi:MAG: DMT family transporter [Spirochaetes bacterium]|nr:DMT family transporter [Spirochaetota bacterium]